jgi:fatty acid desaturase
MENVVEAAPNPYRMLQRVVRHGAIGVKAVTALTLAFGVGAALSLAWWWLVPVVLLAAGLVYVLGQSFVELVTVIVDMMVPK